MPLPDLPQVIFYTKYDYDNPNSTNKHRVICPKNVCDINISDENNLINSFEAIFENYNEQTNKLIYTLKISLEIYKNESENPPTIFNYAVVFENNIYNIVNYDSEFIQSYSENAISLLISNVSVKNEKNIYIPHIYSSSFKFSYSSSFQTVVSDLTTNTFKSTEEIETNDLLHNTKRYNHYFICNEIFIASSYTCKESSEAKKYKKLTETVYTKCNDDTYAYNFICNSNCNEDTVKIDIEPKYCFYCESIADLNKYLLKINNSITCENDYCPRGFEKKFLNHYYCKECTDPSYELNGKCTDSGCPDPYAEELNDDNYRVCNLCLDSQFLDNKSCENTCSFAKGIANTDERVCKYCGEGKAVFKNYCVESCPLGTKTTTEPDSIYGSYIYCILCSDSLVYYNGNCIPSCQKLMNEYQLVEKSYLFQDIFTISYCDFCDQSETSNKKIEFDGECVESCQRGYGVVQFNYSGSSYPYCSLCVDVYYEENNICTETCTSPLAKTIRNDVSPAIQICSLCSEGKLLESGVCENKCNSSSRGETNSNQICDYCIKNELKNKALNSIICVEECPSGYEEFTLDEIQIDERNPIICRECNYSDFYYEYKSICYSQCPYELRSIYNGDGDTPPFICEYIDCDNPLSKVYEEQCIDNCLDGYYFNDYFVCFYCNTLHYNPKTNECVNQCPVYSFTQDNLKNCLFCENQTKINSSENGCVDQCESNESYDELTNKCIPCEKILFENSCIESCPFKYIKVMNTCALCGSALEGSNNKFYNLLEKECVFECRTTQIKNEVEKTCQTCLEPNIYRRLDNLSCVNDCGRNFFPDSTNECIDMTYKYLLNNSIENYCPEYYSISIITNNIKLCSPCSDKNLIYYDRKCVSECPRSTLLINLRLEDTVEKICFICNGYFIFTEEKLENNYIYEEVPTCHTLCPLNLVKNDNFRVGNSIVKTCEIPSCPNFYFSEKGCVESCPIGTTLETSTKTCKTCTELSMYRIKNSECVVSCDKNKYLVDEENKICYDKVESNTEIETFLEKLEILDNKKNSKLTCNDYCENNGICTLNEDDSPICQCTGDYTGEKCHYNSNNIENEQLIIQNNLNSLINGSILENSREIYSILQNIESNPVLINSSIAETLVDHSLNVVNSILENDLELEQSSRIIQLVDSSVSLIVNSVEEKNKMIENEEEEEM